MLLGLLCGLGGKKRETVGYIDAQGLRQAARDKAAAKTGDSDGPLCKFKGRWFETDEKPLAESRS